MSHAFNQNPTTVYVNKSDVSPAVSSTNSSVSRTTSPRSTGGYHFPDPDTHTASGYLVHNPDGLLSEVEYANNTDAAMDAVVWYALIPRLEVSGSSNDHTPATPRKAMATCRTVSASGTETVGGSLAGWPFYWVEVEFSSAPSSGDVTITFK